MPPSASLAPLVEALLAAVPDAVLLCAPDGQILRANAPAADLLDDAADGGAALVGQSAFEFLDGTLVRGAAGGEPFATRVGPHLVEVHKASVDDGFALVLRTAEEPAFRRDAERLALGLAETIRGPLASIRAAIETLTGYPEMDETVAAQFTTIIREQTVALSRQLEEAAAALAEATKARRPLEHVRAERLQAQVVEAVRATGVGAEAEPPPDLVVRVEWPALERGVAHLATRLAHATRAETLTVRVGRAGGLAALDLGWRGATVLPERLDRWLDEPLTSEEGAAIESLREVLERHGGACWGRERADGRAAVRLLLPALDAWGMAPIGRK
jgi:DNA polymerase-3 subunit epsilon